MKTKNIFVVTVHCIVFVLNMGLGINLGFVIDQWFTPVFNTIPPVQGIPVGSILGVLVALASGAAIGFGAYGLFIHSEQAWKNMGYLSDTDAERRVRRGALIAVNVFWIVIGILGLAFRLEFLTSHGVGFLFVIGSLLDIMQPLYGLILYPMIHMNADMLEEQQIEQFRSRHVGELYNTLGDLPLHQRHRAYMGLESGNEDEVLDVLEEDIAVKQAREQMKARRKPQRVLTRRRKTDDLPEGETEQDFPQALPAKNGRASQ